ncbi:MAG: HNH endonuclease [Alphaproteobacteria bacterium]|nr:HNH endonuclease [Alphaproteobacteria bacterium]
MSKVIPLAEQGIDACHRYNDFTDRAWEIGWLHSVFDDDTLLNNVERQQFKAWIIDREMRPKSGNFTEVFNAVLNIAEITGIASSLKVMNVAKLPKLTPAQRLDFRRALDKLNKAPYDPRSMEKLLKSQHPDAKISSLTLPKANANNVKLAGKKHPETEIVFDKRGFPIYDNITFFDTRICGNLPKMTREQHMKLATEELRNAIESGKISKALFTEKQLEKIMKGEARIPGLTWHHHQDVGRMQLVPTDIHKKVGHIGGFEMWK